MQRQKHSSNLLKVATCVCAWQALQRRRRQQTMACYWWLSVMACCAAAGTVQGQPMQLMISFFQSLFLSRRCVGALRRLAECSLPREPRCTHKVERVYATVQFFDYLKQLGHHAYAHRWFVTRVRMTPATFEKLLGLVEALQHPLLVRKKRADGGVRDDVTPCAFPSRSCPPASARASAGACVECESERALESERAQPPPSRAWLA